VIFYSQRNSFFAIVPSTGTFLLGDNGLIDPEDILSISVTEELGKTITGSISMRDPKLLYSMYLVVNRPLIVSWGYKLPGADIADQLGISADKFASNLVRRGLSVFVMNPSGNADGNGYTSFSCGFMSAGWFGKYNEKTFKNCSRYDLVNQVLDSMGVFDRHIAFGSASQMYNEESVERQSESDFSFLARLSTEWRCVFKLGFNSDRSTYCLFYGFEGLDMMAQALSSKTVTMGLDKLAAATGFGGLPKFSYRNMDIGDIPVISYSWQNEEGENGQGDNVTITNVNGQMVHQRFKVKDDVISTWDLDMDAIKKDVGANGFKTVADVMAVANSNFKDQRIQKYWRQIDQKTAPNGYGYTLKLHLFGMPMITAGMLVLLGNGFPPQFRRKENTDIRFVVRAVSHSIDQSGYFTDIDIVDMFTVSVLGIL
jgi:hypothetical protein